MLSNKFTWLIAGGFLSLLLVVLTLIVAPFLEGFAWALILVLVTTPVLNWLKKTLSFSDHAAALTLTLGLTALCLIILIPAGIELGKELFALSKDHASILDQIPASVSGLPLLSSFFEAEQINRFLRSFFRPLAEVSLGFARQTSEVIFSSLFNLGVTLFSSYFLYRYSRTLMESLEAVVVFLGGPRWLQIFDLIESTIKGVLYGALLTAPSQGLLAWIGFYFAGAPMPAIWGLATVFISFVPFGAPMVYVPISLYLIFVANNLIAGIGLLLWGIAVVSTIDNIIRPIFIAHAIQISLLLVFVGVVGGIFAFGLIGLFIGPVIVAITQALWKELVFRANESQKVLAQSEPV